MKCQTRTIKIETIFSNLWRGSMGVIYYDVFRIKIYQTRLEESPFVII